MVLLLGTLVLLLTLLGGLTGSSASASAVPASSVPRATVVPAGDSGTTIDPLRYNCGNDAPTCGQVGESYGYYNGTNVDLLYSENYYCDTAVPSHATTGCEVGSGPSSANPTAPSPDGTSIGNTTHGDTLYIPVPLFSDPPPTQCTATATCVDHPPTIDLSAIAGALPGSPSPQSLYNVPIPAHDHVVGTRNGGLPEWWNVQVVATTDPATFATLTSVSAINAAIGASKAVSVPTNTFLFFQVLAGTAADVPGRRPDGHRPSRPGGCHRPGRATGQPGRARHDHRQPPQRLRGDGAQLPEHRHQPRLDRRTGRRRPVHRAVLLRHHRDDGPLGHGM